MFEFRKQNFHLFVYNWWILLSYSPTYHIYALKNETHFIHSRDIIVYHATHFLKNKT